MLVEHVLCTLLRVCSMEEGEAGEFYDEYEGYGSSTGIPQSLMRYSFSGNGRQLSTNRSVSFREAGLALAVRAVHDSYGRIEFEARDVCTECSKSSHLQRYDPGLRHDVRQVSMSLLMAVSSSSTDDAALAAATMARASFFGSVAPWSISARGSALGNRSDMLPILLLCRPVTMGRLTGDGKYPVWIREEAETWVSRSQLFCPA